MRFFTSVVVVNDTLESSNVTNTTLAGGVSTSIFIRFDEDAVVTDFMSGSGDVLFNFQLISSDASAVTGSNMTIRLTELVLVDTSYQYTVIREIPTVYSYVAASYQLLVNGSHMRWDAGSNVTRLQAGVPITFNIYKGSDVVRRAEGFVVLISEGSVPYIALRHQRYMARLQSTLTDDFNYAFKIHQNQTTNLYRFFTDFNDYYIGYDATNEEFRIEPPDSSDIMEFALNIPPPASLVFPLHLTYNTFTVRIGLSSNFDGIEYLWILKAGLPGVTDYTSILGQKLVDDNGIEVTLDYLFSSTQMNGSDPSAAYITSQSADPEYTYKSLGYNLFIYN